MDQTGIHWARLECDLTGIEASALDDVASPLSGEWGIVSCGGDMRALTLEDPGPAKDEEGDNGHGGAGDEAGAVLRFTGQRFANLVASCSLRLDEGIAGLVYRASRKGDYLCMELDPAADTVSLVRVHDGHREALARAPAELPRGKWLHLYLRHVNPYHSLSIDGALVLTAEHRVPGGYLATGALGVRCARPRGAWIARVEAVDVVAGD